MGKKAVAKKAVAKKAVGKSRGEKVENSRGKTEPKAMGKSLGAKNNFSWSNVLPDQVNHN